ncbi:MAG: PIG-L family deacetylase [Planctomycetia bacterium]|nr:PIG-L family deacetylase [Planctomycetia bacterium]
MARGIVYYRRGPLGVTTSPNVANAFTEWRGDRECWMFVAAHDDDIIAGAGMFVQAAIAEGAEVHAIITTDGRMGYCVPQQRVTISKIRRQECETSFGILGLPVERIHFLEFPDCDLSTYQGRKLSTQGGPTEIGGASGLQNAYSFFLRKVRPTRVILPTISDLHPDHRIVNTEMLISLFHAQGKIWPELGEPIEEVPRVYEYATYCDFPEPPQIRIAVPDEILETKLRGIRAYESQMQIDLLIEAHRKGGAAEYLREVNFSFYAPQQYEPLFGVQR